MNPNSALVETLRAVGEVIAEARDPWWIIASGAVALHGADPGNIADIDVLLSTDDALRILPTLGVVPAPGVPNDLFRSGIFATWKGTALPVEFMSDFQVRFEGEWTPVRPRTRIAIELGGWTLHVPDRAELRKLLEQFGRPKDLERVQRLADLH